MYVIDRNKELTTNETNLDADLQDRRQEVKSERQMAQKKSPHKNERKRTNLLSV